MNNYADNILDKDGNPIYLEDKHLNDQTSQTTVATTDAVMLKDTNGGYHSIAKASFNEAVRAAMGTILTNFDKGTSISRVIATDSSNDLGSITTTNLRIKLCVNHPGFVDLGLPSGTLWASRNIGAEFPEDYGLFFSWANIEGHEKGSGYNFNSTTYNSTKGSEITSGSVPINIDYDGCQYYIGGACCIPNYIQFKEIVDNTTRTIVTKNNIPGVLFTSNINGNSVFFPMSGYYKGSSSMVYEGQHGRYWARGINSSDTTKAMQLHISTAGTDYDTSFERYSGLNIRPIMIG